jgi:hypothetical protein
MKVTLAPASAAAVSGDTALKPTTATAAFTDPAFAANAPAALELYICEHVSVEFVLPGEERPLTVRCVVRNRRRRNYGMEFIALGEAGHGSLSLIDSILHNLAQ